MLQEALYRAALAGGVPPFEQQDDTFPGLLYPPLHLQQLDLQLGLLALVRAPRQLGGIGVGVADDLVGTGFLDLEKDLLRDALSGHQETKGVSKRGRLCHAGTVLRSATPVNFRQRTGRP